MGKNKEQLEKTTKSINEMAKEIQNLTMQIQLIGDALNELSRQIKAQQPIVINPSPVWPTNDPSQPTQPHPWWWEYTPTITSTTTETITTDTTKTGKTGDAK